MAVTIQHSVSWIRNPHIKGHINPSMGFVVAIPGDKHPCYGGCESSMLNSYKWLDFLLDWVGLRFVEAMIYGLS